jgi:hypothetical protein
MDGFRTMVGLHVCASRTAPQCQSRQWFYGAISNYLWDEEAGLAAYHLAVALEEEPTIIRCPSIHWTPVDLFCFGLRPFSKNSTLLHSADQVHERHDHLSHCPPVYRVPASRHIGIVHLLRNKSNTSWAKRILWMAGQIYHSLISKHVVCFGVPLIAACTLLIMCWATVRAHGLKLFPVHL